ncbi:winged helix-turn-helix transcriptional regulator [Cellulomonas sp. ICMP 17802]|uniref:winged helix-turn-helix transcriptional regulator n=1 Tax=Cellulomonas sp. ICMP 17802 TaxID=3239199 RepID=UPI00351BDBBB
MSHDEALPQVACSGDAVNSQIRSLLDRVGDKWSLLILGTLQAGPQRFTALLGGIDGISQRMLTLTLRHLERDGLVRREVYAVVPPKVEYELTDLGHTLLRPVLELVAWSQEHADEIDGHRAAYDAARG